MEVVTEYSGALNNTSYLKKGDVVSCVVKKIDDYYFLVDIKTDDVRDTGSVHISRIADRYIKDIRDEVSVAQIIQAKIINDDFYENWFGWKLSMLISVN
ncbi:general stress protein 13 [compost metagenome]